MIVFIGTKEISNWVHLYARAFEENGDTVITCAEPHPFYSDNYTHNLAEPRWLFKAITSPKLKLLESIRFRLARYYRFVRKYLLLRKYANLADLFVFVGDGFFRDSTQDFRFLKKKGKKIVHIFYGGDVRDWDAFGQKYGVDVAEIEDGVISCKDFNEKIFRLRKSELYADALFSVEDQGVLAIRPFHKLLIPFELGKCRFIIRERDVPKVVHIESRRPYKGEKFIYNAIEKLRNEGLRFEFTVYKGLSHSQVYEVLEDADILVDEVMIFGPGTLGHEAIACGCALATKMQPDHFLREYVCNLDYNDIVDPLREFIADKAKRIKNLQKSYELLVNYTKPDRVAAHIIEKLMIEKYDYSHHDYFPKFIYEGYSPPKEHVLTETTKKMTAEVVRKYINTDLVKSSLRAKGMM